MKTIGIVKALEIQRIDLKTKLEIPWKTKKKRKNKVRTGSKDSIWIQEPNNIGLKFEPAIEGSIQWRENFSLKLEDQWNIILG
jgi:hypothetical protein